MLEMEKPGAIYARFSLPLSPPDERGQCVERSVRHMNAGLGLFRSGLSDGITWLVSKPHVTGFRGRVPGARAKNWSPVTPKNTALSPGTPFHHITTSGWATMAGMADSTAMATMSPAISLKGLRQTPRGYVREAVWAPPVEEHKGIATNYRKEAMNAWGMHQLL